MKLYATDFDGTLTYDGITPELLSAIAGWRAAGHLFGIVTGRSLHSILKTVQGKGIPCDFLLANNGAVAADGQGKVMLQHCFTPQDAVQLAHYLLSLKRKHLRVDTTTDSYEITKDGTLSPDCIYAEGDYLVAGDLKLKDLSEMTTVYDNARQQMQAGQYVTEHFEGRISPLIPCLNVTDHVPGACGKNIAIHQLVQRLGIAPQAIYTTGDSQNDLSMLTDPAFTGFAVPNAYPQVIAAVGRTAKPIQILQELL